MTSQSIVKVVGLLRLVGPSYKLAGQTNRPQVHSRRGKVPGQLVLLVEILYSRQGPFSARQR